MGDAQAMTHSLLPSQTPSLATLVQYAAYPRQRNSFTPESTVNYSRDFSTHVLCFQLEKSEHKSRKTEEQKHRQENVAEWYFERLEIALRRDCSDIFN